MDGRDGVKGFGCAMHRADTNEFRTGEGARLGENKRETQMKPDELQYQIGELKPKVEDLRRSL